LSEAYTYRLPQERETEPRSLIFGRFRVRFAYGRSQDSRAAKARGQDYLALRLNRERLAFVLCDGVSQSFFGDLAAGILGDLLLDWMWDRPITKKTLRSFEQDLTGKLTTWMEQAKLAVEHYRLPPHMPAMVQEVLERKRGLGSETMFACGLVQLPDRAHPEGILQLAWLGDTRLQLWHGAREGTARLNANWDERGRWSTHEGPKGGPLGAYLDTLEGVDRLIAYSDGFLPVADRLALADETALAKFVQDLLESPTSDDVSLLDIAILPEPHPSDCPVMTAIANQPPDLDTL